MTLFNTIREKLTLRLLAVLLVVGVAAFLRFYRLPELFVFTLDEEYQAQIADTLVKHFHLIWIGVSASNVGYLGPYWSYFTAFWLFLARDPVITAYVAAGLGILTTILVFFTGLKLFNFRVALAATTLYATLPLIVFFDQRYWNPSLVPFLSLTIILSLYLSETNKLWWLVSAAAFGLIFHTHLSLFPYILLGAWVFWTQRKKMTLKIVVLSALCFLIVYWPLLVFDYFHNWSNLTTPLRLNQLSTNESEKVNPGQHFQSFLQTLGRLWYLRL